MWPSVPKIIPEKNLGTAYSLIYWIQNMGLYFVPKVVGRIFASPANATELEAVAKVEWLFIVLALVAISVATILRVIKLPEEE